MASKINSEKIKTAADMNNPDTSEVLQAVTAGFKILPSYIITAEL